MHRQLVYPGQIPLETDVLSSNKDAYLGIAKLAQALFGSNTVVNGLSCTATSPASLAVYVNPGEIYSVQQTDSSAYSTLGTDTATILKQGILAAQTTLNTPAPGTAGQSINYLIQAGFVESDANSVVLPYYNASNPSVAWSGPANSGTAQFTQRQDLCSVQVKAGTAATTGTQSTPAPDAGYVGLWVVTVANGQSTVTSTNISAYTGAPFLHGPNNDALFPINNYVATVDPAAANDSTQGYIIGSKWLNTTTNVMFICCDASAGAAVWKQDTSAPVPNFFVDPCCRVAQGAAPSLSTSRQYGAVDLVQAWVSGSGATVSAGTITQDTTGIVGGITPYSCYLSGVTTTGVNAAINFRRWTESRDSLAMVNQTCTFSCILYQNTGATINGVTIAINKANAQDNFSAVTNIGTSGNISIASGVPTVIEFTVAMGTCGNGVEMIVNAPCGVVTTKNFGATDWRVSIGSSVQVFAIPKFQDDLINVMRYFETSYEYGVAPGTATTIPSAIWGQTASAITNGSGMPAQIQYRVKKAVTPTVTIYSPSTGTSGTFRDNTTGTDKTSSATSITTTAYTPLNNSGGTIADGDQWNIHHKIDARL